MKDLNRDVQSLHKIVHLFEHARLQSERIVDALPALFCVVDEQGVLYRGNRFLGDIMSENYEELIGRSISSIFFPNDWAEFKGAVELAIKTNKSPPQFELDLKKNESKLNFLWHLSPLHHEFEDVLHLVSVYAVDVSELKSTTKLKARMESELETAMAVQSTLLPPSNAEFKNCTIAGRYHSASECGGDLWFYAKNETKIITFIGDVTGHGASAALIASAIRAVLSVNEIIFGCTAAEILGHLNKTLCDLRKTNKYMTAIAGILDVNSGNFTYAYAAHEPFIVIRASPQQPSDFMEYCIPRPSNPLGNSSVPKLSEGSITLNANDRILFYTDGLYEMLDASMHRKKALRELGKILSENSDAIVAADVLDQKVVELSSKGSLEDDVTFLLMQFKPITV